MNGTDRLFLVATLLNARNWSWVGCTWHSGGGVWCVLRNRKTIPTSRWSNDVPSGQVLSSHLCQKHLVAVYGHGCTKRDLQICFLFPPSRLPSNPHAASQSTVDLYFQTLFRPILLIPLQPPPESAPPSASSRHATPRPPSSLCSALSRNPPGDIDRLVLAVGKRLMKHPTAAVLAERVPHLPAGGCGAMQ
jgi:hypothetical protein